MMAVQQAEQVGINRDSTVSVRVVRALLEVVEQKGVPLERFLRVAQLDPEEVHATDARWSRARVYGLCEAALELTGDAALGLHWAETVGDGTFVPISALIAHSPTLRQGFESLAHYYRLLSDQASFQFIESDDKVTVRGARIAGGSLRMQRFVAEMMAAGFQRLVRCVRAHARPESVNFEYPAPSYAAEYVRVFGDVVRFDQPFTGLVFDRALMDLPAPHKDEDVHEALKGLAERRLLRITQKTPYALRVRDLLVQQACPLRADMTTVARQLGMSVRSLRRRLAEEDKTYNDVATEALVIVAKQFLGDKQRTIQETAYEMGFSDTSTFHRAFKRWTGITPSAYREAQLAGDPH